MRVETASWSSRMTCRSRARAIRLVTTTKAVTTTSPLSSAHRLNWVRPGIRLMRLRLDSIRSSQPSMATPATSHRISVMRAPRARTHEPGPSSRPSRNTPRRSSTSTATSRTAASTTAVDTASAAITACAASSVTSATRIGASSTAPSRA